MAGPLKFFCDEQLGKLARWLRVIGQDVEYRREIGDAELVDRARAEGRIVLTRDRRLAEKFPQAEIVTLIANYPAHQTREVVLRFADRIQLRVFSRCVACNGEVDPLGRPEVLGLVPDFVYQTQQRFTRCRSCGKIFWRASHRDRVEVQLKDVLGDLYRGDEPDLE